MDIKNTVQVLTRACLGNLSVTTPYQLDTRKLTPGQYSQLPYYRPLCCPQEIPSLEIGSWHETMGEITFTSPDMTYCP
jgi:hypothetical protein